MSSWEIIIVIEYMGRRAPTLWTTDRPTDKDVVLGTRLMAKLLVCGARIVSEDHATIIMYQRTVGYAGESVGAAMTVPMCLSGAVIL